MADGGWPMAGGRWRMAGNLSAKTCEVFKTSQVKDKEFGAKVLQFKLDGLKMNKI